MKTKASDIHSPDPQSNRQDVKHSDEQGAALLLVLWVVVILMVVAFEFSRSMRTEAAIARNYVSQTQTRYYAKAGFHIGVANLIGRVAKNQFNYHENQYWPAEGEPVYRINYENEPGAIADGGFRLEIANEAGKININRANKAMLQMMLNRFELSDEDQAVIADSILDWRDKDSFHRLNGAEDDYYEHLDPPYTCKDAFFESNSELLLVRGVTPEIYYGGLEKMVSVFVRPPKTRVPSVFKNYNYNKVCINAADQTVLESLLQNEPEAVKSVLAYRKEQDIVSLSELKDLIGDALYAAAAPMLTLNLSPYFTVRSVGHNAEKQKGAWIQGTIRLADRQRYQIAKWHEALPIQRFSAQSLTRSQP